MSFWCTTFLSRIHWMYSAALFKIWALETCFTDSGYSIKYNSQLKYKTVKFNFLFILFSLSCDLKNRSGSLKLIWAKQTQARSSCKLWNISVSQNTKRYTFSTLQKCSYLSWLLEKYDIIYNWQAWYRLCVQPDAYKVWEFINLWQFFYINNTKVARKTPTFLRWFPSTMCWKYPEALWSQTLSTWGTRHCAKIFQMRKRPRRPYVVTNITKTAVVFPIS